MLTMPGKSRMLHGWLSESKEHTMLSAPLPLGMTAK
jgi:hypothetical protein